MFQTNLAINASERWQKTFGGGKAFESMPAPPISEDAQQRRDRISRLSVLASREKARSLVLAADASPRTMASQSDVIRNIGFERVIGTRDLLDINFLELAIAMSRAVGRLHGPGEFATGFLIGPRLLATNNHVFGERDQTLNWALELDYQDNSSGQLLPVQRFKCDPGYFFFSNKGLDFTVTGVAAVSDKQKSLASYPWVKLIADSGKTEVGDPVNIIQHPQGGLKQIAFRKNTVLAVTNAQPDFLCYSTDTEPGSSGSPCFNDQWELVAVHHSGVGKMDAAGHLLNKGGNVWKEGDDPESIDWIGNEGARVSAIVRSLQAAALSSEFRSVIDQALAGEAPNAIELARSAVNGNRIEVSNPPQVTKTRPADDAGNDGVIRHIQGTIAQLQIPLIITVTLGGQSVASAREGDTTLQESEPRPDAVLEKVVIDTDWNSRRGFLTNFLGNKFEVELPFLSDEQLKTTAEALPEYQRGKGRYKPYELLYWNYSVLINKRYRTAWFSAANVDGDNRFKLPPRQGDKWFQDPRMSTEEQLSQAAFETGIDRGHLTRREDAAWGQTASDATRSTNDTFHFTNCSLQASLFNRGKSRWQGLEQFLLERHAKPELRKMQVITGPVFSSKDPSYRNDKMDFSVTCPLQFWKVCVLVRRDNTLSATGFILGQQEIADLPGFEAFDVGAAQITLSQLEDKTGLKFGALKDADNFAKTHEVGALETLVSGGKRRILRSFDDIVV